MRPIAFNPALPLEEAIDFGKHHPCWVARQVDPFGAVLFLGGIQGEDLFLDDFMRVVTRYREEWFPERRRTSRRAATPPAAIRVDRACGRTASRFCARTTRRGTAFAFRTTATRPTCGSR